MMEEAELEAEGRLIPLRPNPFCPAVDVEAPLVFASSLESLASTAMGGVIVVLSGSLTAEPLFPRNFPFVTIEEHRRTLDLLDEGRPLAVICVSPMEREPSPVIEDGDFHLPSVTVAAGVEEVLRRSGRARLRVRAQVRRSSGANVVARRSGADPRPIIICAHFDTKPGTPGALDNAAGVATLLAAAEAAREAPPSLSLEFVAFNGEDYYASSGQIAYLSHAGQTLRDTRLVINLDGVGLRGSASTVALFGVGALEPAIRRAMKEAGLPEAAVAWPQGDHMIFAQQGVPAIALTSEGIFDLLETVIHTAGDTPALVDPAMLSQTADFVNFVCRGLGTASEG
jgi:aminopeptidase YwaD